MDNDQRIMALEKLVSDMRVDQATMEVTMDGLKDVTARLTVTVDRLNSALNRASGALWVIGGVCGLCGMLAGFAITIIGWGHHP